jgi:hypothetical protein
MLASFVNAIVIEWAQIIYPSREWINPALGAHTSTYPIGIPKRHFFNESFYARDG